MAEDVPGAALPGATQVLLCWIGDATQAITQHEVYQFIIHSCLGNA